MRRSSPDAALPTGSGNAEGATAGKRFLSAAEVGALLGIRRSRVYELVACGALPHIRLSPRKIVFPLRAIEAMEAEAVAQARAAQARLREAAAGDREGW